MFITFQYLIFYYLLIFHAVNCDNNSNSNNEDSIKDLVTALKNQASNLVSQINLIIDSNVDMLPTTTPDFNAELSLTFLATPANHNPPSRPTSATPAKSVEVTTPTITTNAPTGLSLQHLYTSSAGTITNSQLHTSQPADFPSGSDSITITENSLDLFPMAPTDTIPTSIQPTSTHSYGVLPNQTSKNSTSHSDTTQTKSLSVASNSLTKVKLKKYTLILILGGGIIFNFI